MAEPSGVTRAGASPAAARAAHVVLVGLSGTGKTTVGRRLAKELGRPFADADEQIELRSGRTIPDVFATEGEERFRELETEAIADLLDRPSPLVVAAGGGAVTRPATRELLARPGVVVVWLRASPQFLAARTDTTHRPLLAGDAEATLARHLTERTPLYAEVADLVVDVEPFHVDEGKPKRALARHIADRLREREAVVPPADGDAAASGATGVPVPGVPAALSTVHVQAGRVTYPVVVGPGARRSLDALVPASARRVAVVTQPGIGLEVPLDREHAVFTIGDGEPAKTVATVEELCRAWSRWGLTRADAVVAVGGGVVTDTAGFAAAVYHRGVAVVHVPTTLLGMVDAAIGGKTGVNLPEGKNLIGAFWQPHAVVCDTDALACGPNHAPDANSCSCVCQDNCGGNCGIGSTCNMSTCTCSVVID